MNKTLSLGIVLAACITTVLAQTNIPLLLHHRSSGRSVRRHQRVRQMRRARRSSFPLEQSRARRMCWGAPGMNPPVDMDGDFLIGPDYVPAPELTVKDGVPKGKCSSSSWIRRTASSSIRALRVTLSARLIQQSQDADRANTPIDYQRTITVYVPAQYVPGTAAPFIVTHDGPGWANQT